MTEKREYYIYRHLKPCGEVFYVGLSKSKRRAKDKSRRSKFWKSVVARFPSYEVQIICKNLTKEEAVELEETLISWYGRRDLGTGTLVNMTNGGDGVTEPSEENRKANSERAKKQFENKENHHFYGVKGEAHPCFGTKRSEESKQLMSRIMSEKYSNGKHPLLGKPQPKNKKFGADNHWSKPLIDAVTLEQYVSVRDASAKTGIEISRLHAYLSGRELNRTNLVYLSEYVPGMQVKQAERIPHKKEVLDTATGIVYKSIAEAERQLGFTKGTLRYYLKGIYKNTTTLIFKPNE